MFQYNDNELIVCGCSYTKYLWPTWGDFLCFSNSKRKNIGHWAMGSDFVLNEVYPYLNSNKNTTFIIAWPEYNKLEGKKNGNWYPYGSSDYFNLRRDGDCLNYIYDNDFSFQKALNYTNIIHELMDSKNITHYFLSVNDIVSSNLNIDFIESNISNRAKTPPKIWKKGLYDQENQPDKHLSCHDNFLLAKYVASKTGFYFTYSEKELEDVSRKVDKDVSRLNDINVLIKKPIKISDYITQDQVLS